MAFLSKKEFADKCGMTTGNLSNYITRKKVMLSGEVINDAISPNKEFLEKWSGINNTKELEFKAPIIKDPERNLKGPNTKGKKSSDEELGWHELEKRKKALDIEKTFVETELLELKKGKMQGDNIPTSAVRDVFIRHNKSLLSHMKSGIENLIIEIESTAGLTSEQTGKIRGEMKTMLNTALNNAVNETQQDLVNIVSDNSIKKGIGEHE